MNRLIPGHNGGLDPVSNDAQGAAPADQDDRKLSENPEHDIAPNASVWKKYVDETDRYDADMVKGWDNSLDVLLSRLVLGHICGVSVFPSIINMDLHMMGVVYFIDPDFGSSFYSFVLESTNELKPDYVQLSAETLTAILQAVSSGDSANSSVIPDVNQSEFSPTPTAITVNILWFMSLSLSVAVALIAIVAKDWCYQFMSGRTGQFILQGRRRQLRWEGIEKWKMQGMLNVLPLMMHAALLLFAVGLSLYLWDINPRVALPVVATTVLVGLFYVVTLLLPLFFRYCPFTTGFIKMLLPSWYKVAGTVLKPVLQVFGWLLVPLLAVRAAIKHCIEKANPNNSDPEGPKLDLHRWITQIPFRSFWNDSRRWINNRIQSISLTITADRSKLDNQDTPMDDVTSSMLGWMIVQCEDPNSVDIALKTLLYSKPSLPRHPLVRCRAFETAVIRLSTSVAAWKNTPPGSEVEHRFARDVFLQSRCLSMMSQMDTVELPEGYLEIIDDLCIILNVSWSQDQDYYLASIELGSLSLHLGDQWQDFNNSREQVDRQWRLIHMIVSKEATGLHPADICHLVDGVAKSYLYEPDQSPSPLVDLLAMSEYKDNDQLRRMIGIALTTARLANYDYPGCSAILDWPSRQKRARSVYVKVTTTQPMFDRWDDHKALLAFGLLGVFLTEPGSNWRPDRTQVVDLMIDIGVDELTIIAPSSLGLPQYPLTIALRWLLDSAHASAHTSSPGSTASESTGEVSIEMAVSNPNPQARRPGGDVCGLATARLQDPAYLEHTVQFIRLLRALAKSTIRKFRTDRSYYLTAKQAADAVVQSNFYHRTRQAIDSEAKDIIPHCMSFIWVFTRCLLVVWPHHYLWNNSNVPSILEPFRLQDDLPDNATATGFVESWIGKLEVAYQRNPQGLLDSEVLNEMIEYYREDEHQDLRPRAEGESGSETPKTWLEILTDLRQSARLGRMMQAQAQAQSPRSTEMEEGAETPAEIETEAMDESADRRPVEEGMQSDQSPPAAHE